MKQWSHGARLAPWLHSCRAVAACYGAVTRVGGPPSQQYNTEEGSAIPQVVLSGNASRLNFTPPGTWIGARAGVVPRSAGQQYASPLVEIAQLLSPPLATERKVTGVFRAKGTYVLSVEAPPPGSPGLVAPQHSTRPSVATPQVCLAPLLIMVNRLPPCTGTGVIVDVLVLPVCAAVLLPQQYASPVWMRPQVKAEPAVSWRNERPPATGTGVPVQGR